MNTENTEKNLIEEEIRSEINKKIRRHNAYCALELMIECLRLVQQHRGAVMGYLGNHASFEENIQQTNNRINSLFNVLADFHFIIDKKTLVRISAEWKTASHVDSKDTPLQQFELHCHLAKNLIDFIWRVIEEHDFILHSNNDIKRFNEILLKDFLGLIERIGQCRALATLISASDDSKLDMVIFEDKLAFTLKNISQSLDTVYQEFSYLPAAISNPIFSLLNQYQCRHKIQKLEELIKQSILKQKKIEISAESIFYLFTMAMDEQYDVFYKFMEISSHRFIDKPH